MEINPNHPVTQTVHDHWHKIAAILMIKFGVKSVDITDLDVKNIPSDIAIAIESKPDHLRIFLTDMKTAEKLAMEEGGLPC